LKYLNQGWNNLNQLIKIMIKSGFKLNDFLVKKSDLIKTLIVNFHCHLTALDTGRAAPICADGSVTVTCRDFTFIRLE